MVNFILWFSTIFTMGAASVMGLSVEKMKFEHLDLLAAATIFYNSWEFNTLSLMFTFLLLIVSMAVYVWAVYYMSLPVHNMMFYVVLNLFILSMLLLILSDSIFSIFLGWEGLGVSSFLLVIFYQNWSSTKGGLLTLLTNRLGDAAMLIMMTYWMLTNSFYFSKSLSSLSYLFIVMLVLTKSAQWPFFSWLPAAMAAPTPISALVHSSTLVTAGVWLLIRFSASILLGMNMSLVLGALTLSAASLAAMSEKDGKKVVALSTLSQLGLMFVSLSLGSALICQFHVITHALAKANLFMMVGNLLHKSYSEQDSRFLFSGSTPLILLISVSSVFSLMGLVFSSGFYSKEMVLAKTHPIFSSMLSATILISITSLTLVYCVKLIISISKNPNQGGSFHNTVMEGIPAPLVSILSMVSGYLLLHNINVTSMMLNSLNWAYWMLALMGFSIIFIYEEGGIFLKKGFHNVSKVIDKINNKMNSLKYFKETIENQLEATYLFFTVNSSNLVSHPNGVYLLTMILFICLMLNYSEKL